MPAEKRAALRRLFQASGLSAVAAKCVPAHGQAEGMSMLGTFPGFEDFCFADCEVTCENCSTCLSGKT